MLTLLTLFIFRSKWYFFGGGMTLQNSIEIHTTQNYWKGTGTYIYTDCYSIPTYSALRCNMNMLMERISTLFNYILSLPMLQFTNMLTLTVNPPMFTCGR